MTRYIYVIYTGKNSQNCETKQNIHKHTDSLHRVLHHLILVRFTVPPTSGLASNIYKAVLTVKCEHNFQDPAKSNMPTYLSLQFFHLPSQILLPVCNGSGIIVVIVVLPQQIPPTRRRATPYCLVPGSSPPTNVLSQADFHSSLNEPRIHSCIQ